MVWKACSTLIASLALVSKYGMLFLLWHQACARLVVTWNTKELMLYLETPDTREWSIRAIFKIVPLLLSLNKWCTYRDYLDPPVCSPSRSCCPAPQKESSLGLEDWPGSRTRPSSCQESWRCWVLWRQTPGRSSRLRGRTLRLRTGTSPDLPYPKSEMQRRHGALHAQNKLITVNEEIKVILVYMDHINQISLMGLHYLFDSWCEVWSLVCYHTRTLQVFIFTIGRVLLHAFLKFC